MSSQCIYRDVPDLPQGNIMKTTLTTEEFNLMVAIRDAVWKCNSIQHRRSIPEVNEAYKKYYDEMKSLVATCTHTAYLLSGSMNHMSKYCCICGQRFGWCVMIESATLTKLDGV